MVGSGCAKYLVDCEWRNKGYGKVRELEWGTNSSEHLLWVCIAKTTFVGASYGRAEGG